jgi:predicted amidohydrolase
MRIPASLLSFPFSFLLCACATESVTGDTREIAIAVCQLRCIDGDREGNLERIAEATRTAADAGAQIACFPETAIFGWVNPDAHRLADPIPGRTTEELARIAEENGIMLAIGLAERSGDSLHDSAILIDADGTLLLTHRKVNILTELMDPPYTPGPVEQSNVAQTSLGRIGMLVCADTFREDVVAAIAKQAPDLLIIPYGWAASSEQWPEHGDQLQAWVTHTAGSAGCPVIGVDLVGEITHGPWTGMTYGGQSVVSDATGGVVARLGDRVEEVVVVGVVLNPSRSSHYEKR